MAEPQLMLPPDEVIVGLAKLAKMPPSTRQELHRAIEAAPLRFLFEADLTAYLAERLPTVDRADIRDVINSVSQIAAMAVVTETPVLMFVKGVIAAAKRSQKHGPIDEDVAGVVTDLASLKPISVPSKAKAVLYAYDNVICNSKSLTDLRPVFGDSPDHIDAAVIVHTLRLRYHHGSELKDFFVTMDDEDLEDLIEVLQRSKAKANALKATMNGSAVPILSAE